VHHFGDGVRVSGCYEQLYGSGADWSKGEAVWVHSGAIHRSPDRLASHGTYIVCDGNAMSIWYSDNPEDTSLQGQPDLKPINENSNYGVRLATINADFSKDKPGLFSVSSGSPYIPTMYSIDTVVACGDESVCGGALDITTECDKSPNSGTTSGSPWNKTDGGAFRVVYENGIWELYGPQFNYNQDQSGGPPPDQSLSVDDNDNITQSASPPIGVSTLYATSTDNDISDGITGWTPTNEFLNHTSQVERNCATSSFGALRLRVTGNECCDNLKGGKEDSGAIPPEDRDNGEDSDGNPVDTGESSGKPNTYGQIKDCTTEKFDFSFKGGCGVDAPGAGLQPTPVDNYIPHFETIVAGTELHGASQVKRFRKRTVKVKALWYDDSGAPMAPRDADSQSLVAVVNKLNELMSQGGEGPNLVITTAAVNIFEGNIIVIFSTPSKFVQVVQQSTGITLTVPANTAGLFHQFYDDTKFIKSGVVFIGNSDPSPTLHPVRRRSVIFEEVAQVLGMGQDVEKYCDGRDATDSIFYQFKNQILESSPTSFSEEDKYVVKALYSDVVIPGRTARYNARKLREAEDKQEAPCHPHNQSQQQVIPNNFGPCACYEFQTIACDSTGQPIQSHHTQSISGGTTPEGNSNKDLAAFGNAQNHKGYHVYPDGQGHYSGVSNVSAVFDKTAYHTSKDGHQADLCWNMLDSHGGSWGEGVGPPVASASNYTHTHGYGVGVSFWFKKTAASSGKLEGVITHCYGMGQDGQYPTDNTGGWGIFYKSGKLIFVVSAIMDDGSFEYISSPHKTEGTEYGFIPTSTEWAHYFFWYNSKDNEANKSPRGYGPPGQGKDGIVAVRRQSDGQDDVITIAPVDANFGDATANVAAAPGAEFIIGANKYEGSIEILKNAEIDTVKIYDNVAELDKMLEISEADYNDGKGVCCVKSIYCGQYEAGDSVPPPAGDGGNSSMSVEPFVFNGYYPVYRTEIGAKMASTIHASEHHIINGQLVYMPGGLVLGETIFYGDYGWS